MEVKARRAAMLQLHAAASAAGPHRVTIEYDARHRQVQLGIAAFDFSYVWRLDAAMLDAYWDDVAGALQPFYLRQVTGDVSLVCSQRLGRAIARRRSPKTKRLRQQRVYR